MVDGRRPAAGLRGQRDSASLISGALAAMFGFGAAWSAQVIIWIASMGSQLPGSEVHLPARPLTMIWLGVSSLLLGLLMAYVLARPWLSLLAGVMIICLGGRPRQPGWPPQPRAGTGVAGLSSTGGTAVGSVKVTVQIGCNSSSRPSSRSGWLA
jgi:competence protein ComEC